MQEAVRSPNERRSLLLPTLLEALEARERKAQAERQLQEEKYLRRTQRIYDYHDRQRRSAVELRRCMEFVSSHAHLLETVLRGGAGGAGGGEVPLGAALVRQVAALQRCMTQCVANAARIRTMLAHHHRQQMDAVLAKMEAELSSWTAFLQRVVEAAYSHETTVENLHNMIAEQHRCVREVSASSVYTALCAGAGAGGDSQPEGASAGAADTTPREPPRPDSPRLTSTPIQRD